ncbi:MAG: MotA/TolQ/ExbB proton channel family protein [Polyangiaceae bacterium]|jgi:biopolymer transport protein ExbB
MSDSVTFVVVKATFVLLLVASALTWALVIVKALQNGRIARQNRLFARVFGKVSRLPAVEQLTKHAGPMARVALAGVEAWGDGSEPIRNDRAAFDVRKDVLERSLRQQIQREKHTVESALPVLASIGATAPFVGLFGTVLGIIHALQRISGAGSASLEVVAGPIGEALVATAIGIAVAVPAVLAYNYFVRRLKGLTSDLEDFANTLVNTAIVSALVDKASDSERPSNPAIAIRSRAASA